MSLRFENPDLLWAVVPVLLLLVVLFLRRRSGYFSFRRWILTCVGFLCCVVGLARPQGGHYTTTQRGMHGDLFVAVDISNSMRAEDVSPSRLEFATAFVRRLLLEVPGIRVALFPFAANGYLQMPLSTDLDAAADLASSLTPSITTNQGTDFNQSLSTLLQAISRGKNADSANSSGPTRVLVLSDGESHVPIPQSLLNNFRSQSIVIDTVGVGTPSGGSITVDGRGGFGRDLLRDSSGKPVRTVLDSKTLRLISDGTGGSYYGPRFEETGRIAARLLQGMEFGKLSTTFKTEQELYPFLFLAALLLFALEALFGRWEYFIRSLLILGAVAGAAPASALEEALENQLTSAGKNRAYRAYNLGKQLAKENRLEEAAELFAESAATAPSGELRKRSFYNLGNTLVKLQDPTQALGAYQRGHDTQSEVDTTEKELNRNISENILLAKKLKQKQQEQQKKQESDGEGDSKQPQDPGKAQQFKAQSFDEGQKKRMFDLLTSEEQQILQRLQQGKNQKQPQDARGKQW